MKNRGGLKASFFCAFEMRFFKPVLTLIRIISKYLYLNQQNKSTYNISFGYEKDTHH